MKKGFTLVELSIVLVIIGLLIGGILVGQSLISSSKNLKYISDLQQYNSMIQLFRSNFKALPGDSSKFTPAGDEDGIVGFSGGCNGSYNESEGFYVWLHLYLGGMIEQEFIAYEPTSCGGSHVFADVVEQIRPLFSEVNGTKQYLNFYSNSNGHNFISGVNAYTSVSLDKKLDDGIATTGKYTAYTTHGMAYPFCDIDTLLALGPDPFTSEELTPDLMTCAFTWYPE